MHRYTKYLAVPALLIAMACGRDDRKVDDALSRDLSLAGQATAPQQYISPVEQQGYQQGYAQPQGYASGTAAPRATAPRRTATRTQTSSAGTVSQGSTSSGRVITEKNTKRDAIIGATAGAVIGATTSRDKVKGAVIGGAAGAILGGVIGNNVDIKKRRIP
jgi:hypothetical protein